jgi:hypothetical protein
MRKQPGLLDDVSDSASQANPIPLSGRAPFDQDVALSRRNQIVDQFEGGCLPGAAASQQYQRLSPLNLQV